GAVDLSSPGGEGSQDGSGDGVSRSASGRLTGATGPVLGAAWADVLLVQTGPDLAVLRPGTAGVHVEPVGGLDPALGMAVVFCDDVEAPRLVGAAGPALRIARVLAAAEAAGGARATLDMATEYAKVREQFGRVIGGFQAVKHHLATMLVDAERATAAAWNAARAAVSADGKADLAAAVAAAVALDANRRNAQTNIQV
nr:acyl-CoA dehydrogenase family protein [Micromonospora sp. DSM 115978]